MHIATLLVAAAVGVNCHPSGHAHRSFHAKRATPAEGTLVTATIDGKVVTWTQGVSPFKQDNKPAAKKPEVKVQVKPAEPSPTKEAAKEKESSAGSSSGGSGKGVGGFEAFCKRGDYSQTSKENIAYAGNTGHCGYGSNFKLVASEGAMKGYKYGIKVSGGSKKLVCGAFNKISSNGGIDGFWVKNHALKFEVPAKSEQWIAVDKNTQGGVMCSDEDKIPERAVDGYPLVTWAEVDFDSEPNGGHSGWDASGIPPSKGNAPCNALKFCAIKLPGNASGFPKDKMCSNIAAGMSCTPTNAYGPLDEWLGGLGSSLRSFGDDDSFFLHADYS